MEQFGKTPFDDDDESFSGPSMSHLQQYHQLHWHMPQSISRCDQKKRYDGVQLGAVLKEHMKESLLKL